MEIYHKRNMQTKVVDTIFELRYPNVKVLDGFETSDHHYRALWLSEDHIDAVLRAYSKLGFSFYDCSSEKDKSNFGAMGQQKDYSYRSVQVGGLDGKVYIQVWISLDQRMIWEHVRDDIARRTFRISDGLIF